MLDLSKKFNRRSFMRIIHRRGFALALSCLAVPPAVAAQKPAEYPSRPVRFIIAQTTGTSVDTLARILAVKMGESMGQQFVADNRSGAGGTIGAEIASQAAPDGYT